MQSHWSEAGDQRATEQELMAWAEENGRVVFTHDLDFSAILAATGAEGPSVIQARTQNVLPQYLGDLVIEALES